MSFFNHYRETFSLEMKFDMNYLLWKCALFCCFVKGFNVILLSCCESFALECDCTALFCFSSGSTIDAIRRFSFREGENWRVDEEGDVISYRLPLRKSEGTANWKRNYCITLCRTCFGREYCPVVRKTADWINELLFCTSSVRFKNLFLILFGL